MCIRDRIETIEEELEVASSTIEDNYENVEPIIATPVSEDEMINIVDEEVSGGAYEIPLDLNTDGIVDAVAIDIDGDDFVDVIAIDTNLDQIPDRYIVDSDGDDAMDHIIFDEPQDGIQGGESSIRLDKEEVITIDDIPDEIQLDHPLGNIDDNLSLIHI